MSGLDFEILSDIFVAIAVKSVAQSRRVGLTVFSRDEKKLQLAEFSDSMHYACLESVLLQIRPKKARVLFPDDGVEMKKLTSLLDSCSVEVVDGKKADFKCENLDQDLSRILEGEVKGHHKLLQLELASSCLSCVVVHCGLLRDESNFGATSLSEYQLDSYVRLDRACFGALSILPKAGSGGSRIPTSLFGLLNKCRTAMGSRRLAEWLTQPLVDVSEILLRHDIVDIFVQDEQLRHSVQSDHLRKITDLDKLIPKFHKIAACTKRRGPGETGGVNPSSIASLGDLVKFYDSVVESSGLLSVLQGYDAAGSANSESAKALRRVCPHIVSDEDSTMFDSQTQTQTQVNRERRKLMDSLQEYIVDPLAETLEKFSQFLQLVEHTVDMKEAERGNYVISRAMDASFDQVATEKDKLLDKMEVIRQAVEDEIPFEKKTSKSVTDSVKIMKDSVHGFVFRVTKKDQPKVQQRKTRFRQIKINKTEFLFTTTELQNAVREFQAKEKEYGQLQAALVNKAVSVAATYWPLLEKLSECVTKLDILAAFALVSSCAPTPYCRPNIIETSGSYILLEGSRHPLVEMQPQHTASFISNDVIMDPEKQRLHVITGPNMGGKSTYIRQVALIVLMNQVGCFVPCRTANLSVFTQILCRVGASDVQLRGISTFLAEMLEASCILKTADPRSLVIVDELGRGTSTYEGFGLAWAIAKHLVEEIGCLTLFATHFHEMCALADEVEGIVNKHVTAIVASDKRRLAFLYEVRNGGVDQSYGVQVAQMAGLPENVIAHAQQKSEELEEVERSHLTGGKRSLTQDSEALLGVQEKVKKLRTELSTFLQCESFDDFQAKVERQREQLRLSITVA